MTTESEDRIRFSWQWNRGVVIFVIVFLPLTCALGVWQLQRADEKRSLLTEYQARQQGEPVDVAAIDPGDDHLYRRAAVSASLVNDRNLLLENRVRNGRPGYEVLTPAPLPGGDTWLWVNRGWVEGSYDRTSLPAVPPVTGEVVLRGYLYRSPEEPFSVGEETWRDRWPQVLQNFSPELLASRLEVSVFPYVLRLDPDSPGALQTGWPVVNALPQRHVGYAVQWFVMAAVLAVLFVYANSNLGALVRNRWSKSRRHNG